MGQRLGQHFLASAEIAEAIAGALEAGPEDSILEVGGGRGALTRHLVGQGAQLVVAELDEVLAHGLESRYGDSLTVVRGDAADLDLAALGAGRRWLVIGNLPYYHSSELLLWLVRQHRQVSRAVVMLQAEVAERLSAAAGTPAYGRLTIAVGFRTRCEFLFRVEPQHFRPPPKVVSAVVRLEFREQPAVSPQDEGLFFRLVEHGFRWRRKALTTVLRQWRGLSTEAAEALLTTAGIEPRRRAETLDMAEFARLSDVIGASSP